MSRVSEFHAAQSARERATRAGRERIEALKRELYERLLEPGMECHVGPGKALKGGFWFCASHHVWFRMKPLPGARPAGCPVSDFALKVWEEVGPR